MESFEFQKIFYDAIKELPKDIQLEVYNAIFDYTLYGKEVNLNPTANSIFMLIKILLNKQIEKTEPIEEEEVEEEDPCITVESEEKNEREKIPEKNIVDLWNETCTDYPSIIRLTKSRKNKIRLRVSEMGGTEEALPKIKTIFSKLQASEFMKGENKSGWKANFDWVFENDNNWLKILEGNYDRKQNTKEENVNEIWDYD